MEAVPAHGRAGLDQMILKVSVVLWFLQTVPQSIFLTSYDKNLMENSRVRAFPTKLEQPESNTEE